jgi:hypothetical protein
MEWSSVSFLPVNYVFFWYHLDISTHTIVSFFCFYSLIYTNIYYFVVLIAMKMVATNEIAKIIRQATFNYSFVLFLSS